MLIGRFHGYAVFAEADHVIMQGNISGYDKKRAHDPFGVLRTLRSRM